MKAGLSASEVGELLRLSSTKEIKDQLKSTTQEALDHGVREMTLSRLFVFKYMNRFDFPEAIFLRCLENEVRLILRVCVLHLV